MLNIINNDQFSEAQLKTGIDLEIKDYLIYFSKITKKFGSLTANKDISLGIKKGTVHVLLGENGAGKSTLMHILSGVLQHDFGTIYIEGKCIGSNNPKEAKKHGIGIVQQHRPFLPSLTVYEYILMEDETQGFAINLNLFKRSLRKKADSFNIPIDPNKYIWELSVGERQLLEVFRILYLGSSIIILDEPTSLLGPTQGDKLLKRMRMLADEGKTVILVTHKLREVQMFADYVTVLRKGKIVRTMKVKDTSNEELANLMVGKSINNGINNNYDNKIESEKKKTLLNAESISFRGPRGNLILDEISFSLKRNHILGVAGVSGSGQSELARIIAGIEKDYSGKIGLNSKNGNSNLKTRYIPADRIGIGAPGALTVLENLMLRDFNKNPISKFGFLNKKLMEKIALKRAEQFEIQMSNLLSKTESLSGGNIQRVIIARELDGEFDILVAFEPTAGLDVKAVQYVRNNLIKVRNSGVSILLISSDLDEIMGIADSIMVINNGINMGVFENGTVSRCEIGALMAGDVSFKEQIQ